MENTLKTEIRDLKDQLFNLQADPNTQQLYKIVKLDVNDEVKETLMLLYSDTEATVQSLKTFQTKTLLLVLDKLEESVTDNSINLNALASQRNEYIGKLEYKLSLIDREIHDLKVIKEVFVKRFFWILVCLLPLVVFWIMYLVAPDATSWLTREVRDLLPHVNETIKTVSGVTTTTTTSTTIDQ